MTVVFECVHHVGVTVADMDRAVAFWGRLLGTPARGRGILDGPQLPALVGYDPVRIDRCWIDLPGGVALELLQYLEPVEAPNDPGTARPGNVHICLQVADMPAAHARALEAGARPVSPAPIEVRRGPMTGTRIAYLRDPDGVTIELHQHPGPATAGADPDRAQPAEPDPDRTGSATAPRDPHDQRPAP